MSATTIVIAAVAFAAGVVVGGIAGIGFMMFHYWR